MTNYQCKVCANKEGNRVVVAREMMFGFRDKFTYFKCSFCGCLQIAEPPQDLSKYYPQDYAAHQMAQESMLKRVLRWFIAGIYLSGINIPTHWPCIKYFFGWIRLLKKIKKTSAILEVGCGTGKLLQDMSLWGFKNLTGVDPFIEEDIIYRGGAKVLKMDIFHPSLKQYDLIMLHHSFEHMDHPHAVLARLHELLNSEGWLLIRVPVSDSFAWRKYGVNWYQLDAPRHYFLYTVKSISFLASEHGFILDQVIYDAVAEQFLQSEKYSRDIPFFDDTKIRFSGTAKYGKYTRWLNKMNDGDQVCFILRKQKKNMPPNAEKK
jgi:SAM-dependent methyltransferase